FARRQPGAERPPCCGHRARRRAHVLRGGDSRRRVPPAHRQHAGAFRGRCRQRSRLARLFRAPRRRTRMSSVEAATRFLRGHARATREIVTPEGVTLSVELAEYAERATAFLIDVFFWLCGSILLVLTFALLAARGWAGILFFSIVLFVTFIIRNFYFIHFE